MFDRITFDPQIMGGRACIRGIRVILTFDLDFGEIAALSRGRKVSVVVFRLRRNGLPPETRTGVRLPAAGRDYTEQDRLMRT